MHRRALARILTVVLVGGLALSAVGNAPALHAAAFAGGQAARRAVPAQAHGMTMVAARTKPFQPGPCGPDLDCACCCTTGACAMGALRSDASGAPSVLRAGAGVASRGTEAPGLAPAAPEPPPPKA